MVKDAEANAAEDKRKKEVAEARNSADSLIHSTEKSLAEHGDKVSGAEKSAIEEEVKALKAVLDSGDAASIKAKTEALAKASMKLGEAIYKAQETENPGSGAGASAGQADDAGDSTVVDADFEEVDDRKKGRSA